VEGYNAHLPGVTDFQLHFALEDALNHPQSWTGGVTKIYYTLAQDFLYEDPSRNVLFLDNHDKSRFFSTVGKDPNKFKSGIAFLLTMRGIPSLYYGTELLFSGYSNPDGLVRQDFPGGWKTDTVNKFKTTGRTVEEQEAFNYVKKLANYRKNTPALQVGKLTQFVPENGIYVFFRYDEETTVMVLMNTNNKPANVATKRFEERLLGFSKARNVVTDVILTNLTEIKIERNATLVLELEK
jgi:neopullulanase